MISDDGISCVVRVYVSDWLNTRARARRSGTRRILADVGQRSFLPYKCRVSTYKSGVKLVSQILNDRVQLRSSLRKDRLGGIVRGVTGEGIEVAQEIELRHRFKGTDLR